MIKSELIARLVELNPALSRRDAERVVNAILDEIVDGLAEGKRVELRGFGVFTVRERKPRVSRNPSTNETVRVPARKAPHFKPGKELHERLNRDYKGEGGKDAA